MRLKVETVTKAHYTEIFDFEMKNRQFFERVLPPRPDGYYHYEAFSKIMDDLIDEQTQGLFLMHIIRDDANRFVGRINLQIRKSTLGNKAELGCRIDMDLQGLGYASHAVELVVDKAFKELDIVEVTAGTAIDNYGSQSVLRKNGFVEVGKADQVLKIRGSFVDGLLYSIKK